MPPKRETGDQSRYMTLGEVARELAVSTDSVRAKVIAGELLGADVGNGKERQALRVTRKSFIEYCQRIEAAAAGRFTAAS